MEEEEEEAPLIHSIRSSAKLRSLRVSREENKGQTNPGDSGRATDTVAASGTSGTLLLFSARIFLNICSSFKTWYLVQFYQFMCGVLVSHNRLWSKISFHS